MRKTVNIHIFRHNTIHRIYFAYLKMNWFCLIRNAVHINGVILNVLHSSDIMDYVLVSAPPPVSGLPRPRFSLYLSSQLQYGVVLVYHRQCGFLLGWCAKTWGWMNICGLGQKYSLIYFYKDINETMKCP